MGKGPMKSMPQQVKIFYFQDWCKGHHVLTSNLTHHLTSCTEFAKIVGVLEESGLVETTLKNFFNRLSWTKVSTTCKLMTKCQYTMMFILRKTLSNDLVRTIFE